MTTEMDTSLREAIEEVDALVPAHDDIPDRVTSSQRALAFIERHRMVASLGLLLVWIVGYGIGAGLVYWAALLGASLLVICASASGRDRDMLSISVEIRRAPDLKDPAWPWLVNEAELRKRWAELDADPPLVDAYDDLRQQLERELGMRPEDQREKTEDP